MTNQVLSVIADRRSHRAYESTQLTKEQLSAVLQAAVQSPSAVNRQPWHFSVVQNRAVLDEVNHELRIVSMKKAEHERSPRFADETFDVFYHAPTVIFLSAPEDSYWAPIDCGIAVENIVLAAESLGLGSVILGLPRAAFDGDRADELKRLLHFPEGNRFIIAVSVGIPTDDKEAHPVKDEKISYIR